VVQTRRIITGQTAIQRSGERNRYTFEPPLEHEPLGQRALLVVRASRARANTFHDGFEHVTPIGSLDSVSGQHSLEGYMVYLAVTRQSRWRRDLREKSRNLRETRSERSLKANYGCTLNEEDGCAVTT
jgi:hypothetical protein